MQGPDVLKALSVSQIEAEFARKEEENDARTPLRLIAQRIAGATTLLKTLQDEQDSSYPQVPIAPMYDVFRNFPVGSARIFGFQLLERYEVMGLSSQGRKKNSTILIGAFRSNGDDDLKITLHNYDNRLFSQPLGHIEVGIFVDNKSNLQTDISCPLSPRDRMGHVAMATYSSMSPLERVVFAGVLSEAVIASMEATKNPVFD